MERPRKVVAYVDGFNVYNGALKGTDLKWLDLPLFMKGVFGIWIIALHYFTARITDTSTDPSRVDRQARPLADSQAQEGLTT